MITLHPECRYFLYRVPVNINKSFYSLASIAREQMRAEPLSKDVFIFLNNRRNQLKLLVWQGDGFAIFHKRLEKGTFELPAFLHDQKHLVIPYSELLLILQGISLQKVQYRKRYNQQMLAR
ncbi:IS66 family insertion sequence element accessory protein TnpB [Chitinophaga sp. CF418]|uniref:IS66 family insertion sequence element accessory protein TnpB n=1 Tax=Chitinophaga sp. CF418 TaxID=1855287 RepID=UPI0009223E08|nr:IS66 family insertion sequence element accessory protein TnpB [Chitinophaga sp. CF418]SHM24048.1 transposase [Chitinophaga sp. CF418]